MVWIALLLVLALCPALAEADDPVVVRVGDFSFTKCQLQSAVDSDIGLTETLGQVYLTDAEKQAQREDTINRFIGMGFIECKL